MYAGVLGVIVSHRVTHRCDTMIFGEFKSLILKLKFSRFGGDGGN